MSAPTAPARPAGRFARLGDWAQHHRVVALAGWLAVLVCVQALSGAVGADWRNDFSLPGTESQAVSDLLDKHTPQGAGDTVSVVVQDRRGVDAAGLQPLVERLEDLPGVAAVEPPGRGTIARDGTVGVVTVTLDGRAGEVAAADVERIMDTAHAAARDGMRVEVGGDAVREVQEGEGGSAEGVGMMAALVILVFLFGSLLAAAMPLLIAVVAVGTAIGLTTLASHLATVADFTPPMLILVGLGVGIDYALLVFSRYRSELLAGADRQSAVRTALDTAGRTVFFAGCTVIVALLGLVLLGLGSLQGVAVAVALTVVTTMLAALTFLPALLSLFGPRLERRLLRRRGRSRDGARWRRWSALVQRRPWPFALAAVAGLLALSVPALDLRLGFADASTDPPSTTTRQAYEVMTGAFGPGSAGPLVVVSEGPASADARLARELAATDGVARVTPPVRSPDGAIATAMVFPATQPQSAATHDLVERLRDDLGGRALVGGATAAAVDFADEVASKLALFVGAVVGVSALILLVVFRSVLIPLKAAVLNLLSVGASLGVLVLVFQEGWFGAQAGPIEAFIPVVAFAIVFGLSMDYEVFLLSRMHEEWERTGDAEHAVREGLAHTGRVVTAAAAIMVVVFGAFLLSPLRMLQQMGLSMAVAVLLDALVVRCLIVPAVMQLLGRHAWWLPRPIARRLPRVALERPSG